MLKALVGMRAGTLKESTLSTVLNCFMFPSTEAIFDLQGEINPSPRACLMVAWLTVLIRVMLPGHTFQFI